jgi:HD superfamily phosphodiesterase
MTTIAGIHIPDSIMAREATDLVRDTETELLFHHSRRVFLFGALAGERKQLKYDPELLYIGAMFHDMGLVAPYSSEHERFEVDGANAARDFLGATASARTISSRCGRRLHCTLRQAFLSI